MKKISIETLRKIREETGAGVMRVKKVLEELDGNENKALEVLKKRVLKKLQKEKEGIRERKSLHIFSPHR